MSAGELEEGEGAGEDVECKVDSPIDGAQYVGR